MKKTIKVYLNEEELKLLKFKAEQMKIGERAWLSKFLEKIAKEDLIFVDDNVKKVLRLMDLK